MRLTKVPDICISPQYVADELLRAEGFTDVRYVDVPFSPAIEVMGRGKIDFSLNFASDYISAIDRGVAITLLAGVHVGCYDLFVRDDIRSVAGLKGRRVAVPDWWGPAYAFLSVIIAQIGLDPGRDIEWVGGQAVNLKQLFLDGKTDAYLGFPPETQELRAQHVGRVVLTSAVDLPWSQYFCCTLAGNRDYVRNYPIATKRVLRAILKAADLCASMPERAAQRLVDHRFTARYDYALEALRELPYDKWREYDHKDTVRF